MAFLLACGDEPAGTTPGNAKSGTMTDGSVASGDGDVPGEAPAGGDGDGMASGDGDAMPTGDKDPDPSVPAGPNSWTSMGFDERNWYFNPAETTLAADNAADLEEKWSFEVAGYPPGSPLIVNGKVYVMATGGTYAIDLATGDEVWYRKDVAGTASLAYADGAIYAHANGARLFRLNASDGTTVWGPEVTYELGGCDGTSSPIVGGDLVIVGHSCGVAEVTAGGGNGEAKGGVEAHRLDDGSKAWTHTTVEGSEDGAMVWSSVGIDVAAGVVYAATGNNYTVLGSNSDSIHALDLGTGEPLWRRQVNTDDLWSLRVAPGGPDSDFGANPIVVDGMVAAGEKGSSFWALDPADGEILWSREKITSVQDPAHGGILNSGAFDGSTFYALVNAGGSQMTKLVAMAKADGEDVWPPKVLNKTAWGAPSIANGLLFVPIDDELLVLDATTGDELNKFNTGGTIAAGAPAVAEAHIVVGSGLQYPFDPNAKPNNKVVCYGLP